ncbi:hypothetical protein WS93_03710 [Burkholderia cepacia]|nr:hypothetical protein WS93_03710 [Burkholderia cepacia]
MSRLPGGGIGGPGVVGEAIGDIHGISRRTPLRRANDVRDARVPSDAYRRDYSQPLRMNSTIE